MKYVLNITLLLALFIITASWGYAQHEGHSMSMGSESASRSSEGQTIPKYAVDAPGPGTTNFGIEPVHDSPTFFTLRGDRFEYRSFDDGETVLWDVRAWAQRDYNKLFFESEGEYSLDEDTFESLETRFLYGRAITSFWDLRGGLRYDFEPNPERAFAVLGILGLAPQWFEVDANFYLSEDADLYFRLEAEYDLLLTQRLILQPRLEFNLAAQDVAEYETGTGFTGIELGLRLRYLISRKFAPYIGVSWESALGETKNIVESSGGDPETTSFVAGIRFWF